MKLVDYNKTGRITFGIVLSLMLAACGSDNKKEQQNKEDSLVVIKDEPASIAPEIEEQEGEFLGWNFGSYDSLREALHPFDLNQNLDGKTAHQLRILRNTIPARYGYLFMKSDLRGYFYDKPWYRNLMESRWYGDCENSGLQPAPPIVYTNEEIAFMDRVKKREAELRNENFHEQGGLRLANINNIINGWQYKSIPQKLIDQLGKNGFAIVPNNNVQLFHLYEENDYSQTQNFVTTDLYLQLFHMHFSFMLRQLEEEQFIPILKELLSGFLNELDEEMFKSTDQETKDALRYNAISFSIPLSILDETATIPEKYETIINSELSKIKAAQASTSDFIPAYSDFKFPYDQFKPRGHYTRTESLQKYFNAMQWLQLVPYCLKDQNDLSMAVTAAFILANGHSQKSGKSLLQLYESILTPTTFLIGQPDNLSISDICNVLKKKQFDNLTEVLEPSNLQLISEDLELLAKNKNIIKPKVENTCADKINFMPARFVLDNEILQTMTHLAKRPYPKGLDVLAGFGSEAAEKILIDELKETTQWSEFLPHLDEMKAKYSNYDKWDETVYAKWVQGLNLMLEKDDRYPYFMQIPQWNKKNLNTALASWAELKHDAILYTEQVGAAECGGGEDCEPPPNPYVVGYVEPNVKYWKSAIELLDLSSSMLEEHELLNNSMRHDFNSLRETCTFLLTVSRKELRGEKLSEQEYRTIELIGSSVDYLTRGILNVNEWREVTGPDKEISVVADIYTNNQGDQAGILHVAVGYANDIYVLVEIEGSLYITKGATFSYYEFPTPLDKRMTDEEWQEMLKNKQVYPTPSWMDEIILDLNEDVRPQTVEYIYSSGC
ncbi:DUF3160 domain-containing protein [Fulvivirga ligni]|uniref:DUF3160 domain-containing protein n=1 Tax=Fulvivirga ligni TaxID=2904246 RepID=UPI001F408777|nr:DUF3160 domain-containing protein [Fulvivirga ligni]UII19414.1 DUF3160 domain-containing protein [Fulvivirga ligni]